MADRADATKLRYAASNEIVGNASSDGRMASVVQAREPAQGLATSASSPDNAEAPRRRDAALRYARYRAEVRLLYGES